MTDKCVKNVKKSSYTNVRVGDTLMIEPNEKSNT
jgi:hypothetical protein